MLALFFPGIMKSQEKTPKETKATQSILKPTNKVNYDNDTKKESKVKPEVVVSNPENPSGNSEQRIRLIDKQIAELEKLKAGLTEEPAMDMVVAEGKVLKTMNSQSLVVRVDEYFDLMGEAIVLQKKHESLVNEAAISKTGTQKAKLVKEAETVYKVYELKQIDMSNVLAQINYTKFKDNKITIKTLLLDYNGGAVYEKLVNKLSDEADFAMRMAVEIREEADAQVNNSVRLANYSNAEEKEVVALTKQDEAIEILERTSFMLFTNWSEGLAFTELKR